MQHRIMSDDLFFIRGTGSDNDRPSFAELTIDAADDDRGFQASVDLFFQFNQSTARRAYTYQEKSKDRSNENDRYVFF